MTKQNVTITLLESEYKALVNYLAENHAGNSYGKELTFELLALSSAVTKIEVFAKKSGAK